LCGLLVCLWDIQFAEQLHCNRLCSGHRRPWGRGLLVAEAMNSLNKGGGSAPDAVNSTAASVVHNGGAAAVKNSAAAAAAAAGGSATTAAAVVVGVGDSGGGTGVLVWVGSLRLSCCTADTFCGLIQIHRGPELCARKGGGCGCWTGHKGVRSVLLFIPDNCPPWRKRSRPKGTSSWRGPKGTRRGFKGAKSWRRPKGIRS